MWVVVKGGWDFEIAIFGILEEGGDLDFCEFLGIEVLNEGSKGGSFGCNFKSKLY